jgi:hypothetical protein
LTPSLTSPRLLARPTQERKVAYRKKVENSDERKAEHQKEERRKVLRLNAIKSKREESEGSKHGSKRPKKA